MAVTTDSVPPLASHDSLDCVFRTSRIDRGEDRSANCLLLAQMLSIDPAHCSVTRSMCQVCQLHTGGTTFLEHPVFPSLTFQIATEQLDSAESEAERRRWKGWTDRSESALLRPLRAPTNQVSVQACDVILPLDQNVPQRQAVIESVLNQIGAAPILHLVCTDESVTVDQYADLWNVQIHRFDRQLPFLQLFESLSPHFRSSTIALQDSRRPSDPSRLALALREMRDQGAELHIQQLPDRDDRSITIDPHSIVVRRATLVDLHDLPVCAPVSEIVDRSLQERRKVVWGNERVALPSDAQRVSIAGETRPLSRAKAVHRPVRCDVVLPFRGQLDYVREALEGLLHQDHAVAIIHLIDDDSQEDTTEFLNEWAAHPQLRVYRNRENIGQFQSFNNVSPYWETDLVAVQDADDISLPHRLSWSAEMLARSGADYFGAAVELFGDDEVINPIMFESQDLEIIPRDQFRRSFYPIWERTAYFLENPTAMFRTAMFREMGGYADFGNRLMNRTSLDTEFQLRCLFRGVRFAISQTIVTRYRVHPQSATQDRATGWGSTARAESIRQLEARCRIYQQTDFDPRSFGALGRYTAVTERWSDCSERFEGAEP